MSKFLKFILIIILIFTTNCNNSSEKQISIIEEKDLDLPNVFISWKSLSWPTNIKVAVEHATVPE